MLATLTPPELAAVLSVIIYERADGKDVMVRNRRLKELQAKMLVIFSGAALLVFGVTLIVRAIQFGKLVH